MHKKLGIVRYPKLCFQCYISTWLMCMSVDNYVMILMASFTSQLYSYSQLVQDCHSQITRYSYCTHCVSLDGYENMSYCYVHLCKQLQESFCLIRSHVHSRLHSIMLLFYQLYYAVVLLNVICWVSCYAQYQSHE